MSKRNIARWFLLPSGLLGMIVICWVFLHKKPQLTVFAIVNQDIQAFPPAPIDSLSSLASTLLIDGHPEKSIPHFLVLSQREDPFQESASYYLALAYLANGEMQPARGLLTHLAQNREHTFSEKAAALIEKLNASGL